MRIEQRKLVIIGASRGLGASLARVLVDAGARKLILVARNRKALELLAENLRHHQAHLETEVHAVDFAQAGVSEPFLNRLTEDSPVDDLFYCAGGGCHGVFSEQKLASHEWTLRLNLLAPMELIHASLRLRPPLKNLMVVGSGLAERGVEPMGASYTAAKAGLRSLIQSINAGGGNETKLHLFSPGFLDTQLIPPGSWPRSLGSLMEAPEASAKEMLRRVYPGTILG